MPVRSIAVSYTHLDVYKRQIEYNPPTPEMGLSKMFFCPLEPEYMTIKAPVTIM